VYIKVESYKEIPEKMTELNILNYAKS